MIRRAFYLPRFQLILSLDQVSLCAPLYHIHSIILLVRWLDQRTSITFLHILRWYKQNVGNRTHKIMENFEHFTCVYVWLTPNWWCYLLLPLDSKYPMVFPYLGYKYTSLFHFFSREHVCNELMTHKNLTI